MGIWGWVKLVLLIAMLVPSVYIPRFFCRYICPMGAVLTPLAPYKFLRVTRSSGFSAADNNRVLADVCDMGVRVSDKDAFITDGNCTTCGACVQAAPNEFALEFS